MALDNVTDGSMVVDPNGNVVITNVAARLMLGLREDEATGWKVSDILRENEHLLAAYYK